MTILVTGATGSVGRLVLDQLLSAGAAVRASSRNPEKAGFDGAVEVVKADLAQPETLPAALAGVQKVFLYANAEGIEGFLRAASEAKVEHIVLLSSAAAVGTDPTEFNTSRFQALERAIIASGIAWTFVRPGVFASNTLGWARGIRSEGIVRLPYPNALVTPIHEVDIAAVSVAALLGIGAKVTDFIGQGFTLTGPKSMTQLQQVEAISAAIGKSVQLVEQTPDEARAYMGRFMPEPIVNMMLHYWSASVGVPQPISDTVERVTGHPAHTFEQWALDHVADFT